MVKKFNEIIKIQAIQLYIGGFTIAKINEVTGISQSYIKNLLKNKNIPTRPVGFQTGNLSRLNKSHSKETKDKISDKHKVSGHKPSLEATKKGQPLSLKSQWGKHIKDPVVQLIGSYKRGAIKRSLEFILTREEFEQIINKPCYYCNSLPVLRNINKNVLICNGIDRENNNEGYSQKNCLPCCKICNIMKSNLSRDDFIEHCKKISKRFSNDN